MGKTQKLTIRHMVLLLVAYSIGHIRKLSVVALSLASERAAQRHVREVIAQNSANAMRMSRWIKRGTETTISIASAESNLNNTHPFYG